MEQVLNYIAFPLWRFLAVFSHPPRDLQSLNIALVDNFFFLSVCVMVLGRLVRVARSVISHAAEDE